MKSNFKVYCAECAELIEKRSNLIVALREWTVLPFHRDCHDRWMKSEESPFVSRPLNSRMVSVAVLTLGVIGGFLLTKSWVGIFFFVPLIFRLYSWSKFESLLTLNQMDQEQAELNDTIECLQCRYPLGPESISCPSCGWQVPQPPSSPAQGDNQITSSTNMDR